MREGPGDYKFDQNSKTSRMNFFPRSRCGGTLKSDCKDYYEFYVDDRKSTKSYLLVVNVITLTQNSDYVPGCCKSVIFKQCKFAIGRSYPACMLHILQLFLLYFGRGRPDRTVFTKNHFCPEYINNDSFVKTEWWNICISEIICILVIVCILSKTFHVLCKL